MTKKNRYVIVRGNRSGVFAGTVHSVKGTEVVLLDCRRIWYWDGAASLSQLAIEGPSKPDNCKFPIAMNKVLVLDAIEIIDVTPQARKVIEGVKVWRV